jgi:S1-C subfamily serine protease
MRDEIGDDNYDLLLFATGMNNRVIVSNVLRASPAMEAGILPGDVLVRYDGRRIFNRFELKLATTEGKAGSTVALDLERAGELVRIYAPRGPLGVTMQAGVGSP